MATTDSIRGGVKARELAESWVQVHQQWQEAVYGVEEELLIEEARDIKKEARRKC